MIHSGSRNLGKEVTEYYLNEGQKQLRSNGKNIPYELNWLEGAISAKAGEKVIIPINMRDGILLGTGLGNTHWNCSAPHGAGRILKREEVKNHYTVSSFKSAMKGIYTSCIGKDTLDEAPFAYRSMDEITEVIRDTVTINKIIRPVYNFKAGSTR